MPDYKTHDRIGVIASIPTGLFIGYYTDPILGCISAASVCIGTWFFSPDLDIGSKMIQRWGMLYFIWYPYQKIIPHRSWLSHSGPISATLRLIYLLLIVCIPLYFFAFDALLTMADWIHNNSRAIFFIYMGLIVADTLHVIADKTLKGKKNYG